MKGTLYSADFIEDSSGNLRLLEINTDTGIVDNAIDTLNFGAFINLLSGSSITEVHTITKEWHSNFVSKLSQSLSVDAPFITTFSNTQENWDTIYPTAVEDADNKFILRLAYDESAIFDSTYCKNKMETFKLFHDNSDTGSLAEFYISSSVYGIYDNLPRTINSDYSPDVVVKDLNVSVNTPIEFYKLGHSTSGSDDRYNEFISAIGGDKLTLQYYENPSLSSVESIRAVNVLYNNGTELEQLNLSTYINVGLLEKPTTPLIAENTYHDDNIDNLVNVKHYYEFTTNTPKITTSDSYGGIFEEEEVIDVNGNPLPIASASDGTVLKSYFINGAPDTDVPSEFLAWSVDGSQLPSGSYETSSVVINQIAQDLPYNIITRVVLDDSNETEFRASGGGHILVYDSIDDKIKYKSIHELTSGSDSIINVSGSSVPVAAAYYEVLDGDYKNYIIDMEETDTFFLHNGELSIKIVTHNCFPAGTSITLADGSYKNIEDLTTDDKLLTWDEKTLELREGSIGSIAKSKKTTLVHIETEDGGSVKSTPLHSFYVKEKGWIHAQDLKEGDTLIKGANAETTISKTTIIEGEFEVYHILNVKDTHTYLAEGVVVHNAKYVLCFVAGTEIVLSNGDVKNIEDIEVGEKVLTYNEETGEDEEGTVGDLKKHEVNSVVRLTLDNETIITTTEEHPFYTQRGWVKAGELEVLDVCRRVDGAEAIVSTVEHLSEIHTVYNLLSVSDNHNFYANGILVHNK